MECEKCGRGKSSRENPPWWAKVNNLGFPVCYWCPKCALSYLREAEQTTKEFTAGLNHAFKNAYEQGGKGMEVTT